MRSPTRLPGTPVTNPTAELPAAAARWGVTGPAGTAVRPGLTGSAGRALPRDCVPSSGPYRLMRWTTPAAPPPRRVGSATA